MYALQNMSIFPGSIVYLFTLSFFFFKSNTFFLFFQTLCVRDDKALARLHICKGSSESLLHMHRLVWAFAASSCNNRAFSALLQEPNFGPIPNQKWPHFSQYHVCFSQLRKVKKKKFFFFFFTFFWDHYYLWVTMTHIRMILKHLCISGILGIIQSKITWYWKYICTDTPSFVKQNTGESAVS